MAEPFNHRGAAFLIDRERDGFSIHMRCCNIHLKLDPSDHAVDEAIAWHMSRVHGYIGSIDDEIPLEELLRKLPIKPETD